MANPNPSIALPRHRRPASSLDSVKFEPRHVLHHPREHVMHIVVRQREWLSSDKDYRLEGDASPKFSVGFGSCVVVPDNLTMAYSARHNLMGQRKRLHRASKLEDVSYVPVWAVAISDGNFRAMPFDDMKPWSHENLRRALLHFGGRQAKDYMFTTPEAILLWADDTEPHAKTELCIMKFDYTLAGAVATISRFNPGLLDDRETHEVIQIGFPTTYCTNPTHEERVQPPVAFEEIAFTVFERLWFGVPPPSEPQNALQDALQWCPNHTREQV